MGSQFSRELLELRPTLPRRLLTRLPGPRVPVWFQGVPARPLKVPSRRHTALGRVPSWRLLAPSSTTGLAWRQETHVPCPARPTWTPSLRASPLMMPATSLAGLSLLPLEILPGPANRLKTPPARMLQRPSLSQPTLLTLPVLNLQRLSSTPPSAPPPAVTTLSVLNLLSPTWTLLPLERAP